MGICYGYISVVALIFVVLPFFSQAPNVLRYQNQLQAFRSPECYQHRQQCWDSDKCKLNLSCIDPWPILSNCSEPYHLDGYRLGDVFGGVFERADRHVERFAPRSVAAKYVRLSGGGVHRKVGLMKKIISGKEYSSWPKPDKQSVVIHLRAGDVIEECGRNYWVGEKCKDPVYNRYLKSASYFRKIRMQLPPQVRDVFIITGYHLDSEVNTTASTLQYVQRVARIFQQTRGVNVITQINHNADCDFIFMANAQFFVGTGGHFDDTVKLLIKRAGRHVLGEF